MCRFLAYLTREPTTLAELLPGDVLGAFVSLSCENKDGWGFGWREQEDTLRVAKAPEPAQRSQEFDRLARTLRTDSLIMHLRWATKGLGLNVEDTHPFLRGEQDADRGFVFAHNGAVKPVNALDDLVPAEKREEIEGSTDSERFFLALLSALERESDEEEALRKLLGEVGARCSYTSLNCLLLTTRRLYAVCCYDADDPDARYYLDRNPDYFKLWYRASFGSFVVTSTGWRARGRWETLESGQALVVEKGTLDRRVLDVA